MTAATARRGRPSPVRRRRAVAQASTSAYERTRATTILGVFILVFSFLWLLNGEFTARLVMALGGTVTLGWALHLINSAIEIGPAFLRPHFGHIPRWVLVVLWLLSLPFGVVDVLSSAAGLAPWMTWTGAAGATAHAQNTGLAELVAFLPEPMLLWLVVALRNVLRG